MTSKVELAKKYQKKSDREHVLDNPDMYIGSIEKVNQLSYIYDDLNKKIIEKNIEYIPGLYKLFDEGIVNSRDHVVRMNQTIQNNPDEKHYPVTSININITDDGTISIENDGNGIDVSIHPEYNIWIPELIFGHLRTSTNYQKDEKKIVGGKNGYGFKLVLIWSTYGSIFTIDHKTGKEYYQEFHNNLTEIKEPKISKNKKKPYTKVTFKPDYKKFGIEGLSNDMKQLLKKRVYDIAAVTDKKIKVYFNNELIEVKVFKIILIIILEIKGDERIYEEANDRWEYFICLAPNQEFTQVSFVNGIWTQKGGKHVEYVMNQIVKKLTDYIKSKKHIDVKPSSIKEQLMIFINSTIENPQFDSQTKDYLNTAVSNFGSKCEISDKFIEKIAKMGVMATACSLTEVKDNKAAKKNDGSKCKNIRNLPKLVDANFAGTNRSHECMIILCEGDSAKAGIISGLKREDRDFIGVYPMKGKMLNVRGEPSSKTNDNKEFNEIKQIIGLESGKKYDSTSVREKLRYGKIVFMTDQDLDGSHIKGLGINMFDSEWKSLLDIPDFIGYMNTPILKATKGKELINFYNDGEYEEWKKTNDVNKWKIKYYKGLGTSTSAEFKEYFQNKKIVSFKTTETSGDMIDMIFNKKRANDRKEWLSQYKRDNYLNTNKREVTYDEFYNSEFIHFSKYDNDRSIPNIADGLKISLRKILFAAFKKKLNSEIKVAQFSGYVSEHSGYHHGESSLVGAIIGLAQNFVGSNNINLFEPKGQFGTRLLGGKDSASERYIFTELNKITRLIYPEVDDNILTYLDDDGTSVEPIFYMPIIPMILVNGTKGIGTGFSTDIMCHNPKQIIEYIKTKLKGDNPKEKGIVITPYYRGFKGSIYPTDNTNKKFIIKGKYEIMNKDKIKITELPIGTWSHDYKEFLESLIVDKKNKQTEKDKKGNDKVLLVKDFIEMCTEDNVEFIVTFYPGVINNLLNEKHEFGIEGVEKYMKLYTTQSSTNMHLFNEKEQLRKFDNVYQIIDEYYSIRYEYYNKRKLYLVEKLDKELVVLSNKAKFIKDTIDDKIILKKKSADEMTKMLESMNFDKDIEKNNYNYLTKMSLVSVCIENAEKIMKEYGDKEAEFEKIKSSTIEEIWLHELEKLEEYIN